MVHKVNDVKFSHNKSSTCQKFYSKFQRKILKEKTVKNQIQKIASQKKHPKTWVLYESFDFSEGGMGAVKIAFSLERLYYGRIFLAEIGETFFTGLFPGVFFS